MKALFRKAAGWGLIACGCSGDGGVQEDYAVAQETLDPSTLDGQCVRISTTFPVVGERFLDAYTTGNGDVVTRPFQDDNTQRWCLTKVPFEGSSGGAAGTGGVGMGATSSAGAANSFRYSVRHRTFTGQFLDAYTSAAQDYKAVLRDQQTDGSQYWVIYAEGSAFRIYQFSSIRFLAGYSTSAEDYRVMTRPVWQSPAWTIALAP